MVSQTPQNNPTEGSESNSEAREGTVFKFGGTSVGSIERIEHVADLCVKHRPLAVVVSAMSGETNRLVGLGREIFPETNWPEYDMLVSSGEQVSVALLSLALRKRGMEPCPMLASQAGIRTDSLHSNATIQSIEGKSILEKSKEGKIPVIAGFQGLNDKGQITTLGRGGSDTSAVAVAVAMNAKECVIYTDVDGVYTTDPRIVPEAKLIPKIGYEEMMELSSQGSKVLHMRSVQLASKWGVRLIVRNTFKDEGGTLMLAPGESQIEGEAVTGIAATKEEVWYQVGPLSYEPQVISNLFTHLATHGINVDIISQNVTDGKISLEFTTNSADLVKTKRSLEAWNAKVPVKVRDDVAKLSVVGVGMKTHAGVAAKVFQTLSENNVEVLLVTTSEIKVACLVTREAIDPAIKALHKAFFG